MNAVDQKIADALDLDLSDQSYKGYPVSELRKAFCVVEDKQDWKAPINAPLYDGADLELYEAAVVFFTGTMPTFRDINGVTWCTALGYRMGPCGDC